MLTYDAVVASSKDLYGPYQRRYTTITNGGHGNHFMDNKGNWWTCVFWTNELDKRDVPAIRTLLIAIQWEDVRILPKK